MNTVTAKKKSIEFIRLNYLNGKRLLLIITGKGKSLKTSFFENKTQIGIIRKSLKAWLYESDMRTKILGVVSSHIIHGGEGAFYIYLKKIKIYRTYLLTSFDFTNLSKFLSTNSCQLLSLFLCYLVL